MKTGLTLAAALALLLPLASIGQETVPFSTDKWDLLNGKTQEIGGRQAYAGIALLKEVRFHSGTIEWDAWVTGGRSYAGIVFHQQPTRDYEEFYIRPHKGNGLNADALQYTPVYHGVSCWQLFHGDGYTSTAVIPVNRWIHFRLETDGTRARVTMDGESSKILTINKLELGDLTGRIGVKGPVDGSAWFSNFSYQEKEIILPPSPLPIPESPGLILDWEITPPRVNSEVNSYEYYSVLKEPAWSRVKANPGGLVALDKLVTRNPAQPGWIYARATVHAEKAGLHKYQLGYSDYVTVFLNGTPVFSSTNAYLSRDPGFAGLIGFFDELMLPLHLGTNEITLLVGEEFGGWGFMLRDGEAVNRDPKLQPLWEIKHQLNYPESAVYDASNGLIYVSNFLQGQEEFISQISSGGQIINREWIKGLSQPTGLCLSKGKLFAVERRGVAEIDPQKGEIIRRIPLEGCIFPNDITASDDGVLYISDNEANRIYQVKDGAAVVWMEGGELNKPNNLHINGNQLLVGCSGDPALKSIDLKTQKVTTLARLYPGAIMDGIQPMNDGRILFSDFNGHLFILDKPGSYREILNTTTIQVNLADFEWIEDKKMLVIPGLYSNRVRACRLNLEQ